MNEKMTLYKGSLTREQLITARNKSIINAKNLLYEAKLLYSNERFSRTYFLLCICNEELGKTIIITSAIVDLVSKNLDWKNFWKRIRNHRDKTGTLEHIENFLVANADNFYNPINIQQMVPELEKIKMASLYTDMFQNDFFEPDEFIPQPLVESYMILTEKRVDFVSSTAMSDDILMSVSKDQVELIRRKLEEMESIK